MKKIVLIISLFFLIHCVYSQKGYYVDKEHRIKIYQKEMIKILIDDHWLEKKEKGKIKIKNYCEMMGVSKCIEVFPVPPSKNNVLLVRFYSLGSHALNYWGFLEKDSKYLFYYDVKNKNETEEYLKKYDQKTQMILLDYIKIYAE